MDIKKDIQGQYGNHGQTLDSKKDHDFPLIGGADSFGSSISKKCERLATGLYLVTNFLSDIEPMKPRLRALSIELVSGAALVRYGTMSNENNVLEALRANISETLSFLELALIAGLISEMNFSILKREYASLRDSIDVKKSSRESRTDTVLGDTFFGSSFESAPRTQGQTLRNLGQRSDLNESTSVPFLTNTKAVSIGHSKGQTNTQTSDRKVLSAHHAFAVLRHREEEAKRSSVHERIQQSRKLDIPHSTQKDARRVRILKLIKDNREVSIKDITNYFPELSEKTIQRELVSFTESGILKKTGERRWSRYSLA